MRYIVVSVCLLLSLLSSTGVAAHQLESNKIRAAIFEDHYYHLEVEDESVQELTLVFSSSKGQRDFSVKGRYFERDMIDLDILFQELGDFEINLMIQVQEGQMYQEKLSSPVYTEVSQNGLPSSETSHPDNTYPLGQCTWGVKELAPWIPNQMGNAKDWLMSAQKHGFKVGAEPRLGAISVWTRDGMIDGQVFGHVAYVTGVRNPHCIQVLESNFAGHLYLDNFRGWFDPLAATWGGEVFYIYPD